MTTNGFKLMSYREYTPYYTSGDWTHGSHKAINPRCRGIFIEVHNLKIRLQFNISWNCDILRILVNATLQDPLPPYWFLSVVTWVMVCILRHCEKLKEIWIMGKSPKSFVPTHVQILLLSRSIDNLIGLL